METFSALLAFVWGIHRSLDEFPSQRPVTREFGVFFDLRLNKRLSKQSQGWWFEKSSRWLWCHRNVCPQLCLRIFLTALWINIMAHFCVIAIHDWIVRFLDLFSCLRLRQWPVTYLITLSDWIMSCQPDRYAFVTVCERDWKHKWATHKSFDETSSFNKL